MRLDYGGRSLRSRFDYECRKSRSRLDLRSRLRFGVEVKVEA